MWCNFLFKIFNGFNDSVKFFVVVFFNFFYIIVRGEKDYIFMVYCGRFTRLWVASDCWEIWLF